MAAGHHGHTGQLVLQHVVQGPRKDTERARTLHLNIMGKHVWIVRWIFEIATPNYVQV